MRRKYSQSKKTPRLVLFRLSDLLIFSFGTIVLLVIANIIWVLPILDNVETSAYTLLRSRAHNIASKINIFVERDLKELQDAALLINRNLEDPELILKRLLRENESFDALILLDNEGKEAFIHQNRFLSGSGVLDNSLIQTTNQKQVYISELLFNRIEQPTIEYGIPLNQISGFSTLVGQTNLKFLIDKIFEDLEVKEGDAAYIVDKNGYLIGHTNWQLVYQKTNVLDRGLIAAALAGEEVDTRNEDYIYTNESGNKVFASALPLKLTQWILVVEEAENPTLASARQTLNVAAVSLGFQVLLILLLLLIYFRLTKAAWLFFAERNQREAIMNNLVDGIIEYDESSRIILMNPEAERLLGVTFSEIENVAIVPSIVKQHPHLAALVEVMYPVHAPQVSHIENSGGRAKIMKIQTSKPERNLEVTMLQVLDQDRNIIGFMKILHDITKEVLLEKMKVEFVSVAAHQLRTPLSSMKWAINMLLKGDYGEFATIQKNVLRKLDQSNQRMIILINNLLQAARIEEGRFMYKPVDADIYQIIQSVLANIKEMSKRKGVTIVLQEQKRSLPKIFVDIEAIKLVLHNILENAVNYTSPESTVTISITPLRGKIKVSIQDTGIGISEEEEARIFTKFFRGQRAIRLKPNQSGFGLFIAKNIIETHGGKIWFTSKKNKGTTFYFTLPLQKRRIAG